MVEADGETCTAPGRRRFSQVFAFRFFPRANPTFPHIAITNPIDKEEDFYLPLPVTKDIPQTAESVQADIEYLQEKLFRSIGIPKELLNNEGVRRSSR